MCIYVFKLFFFLSTLDVFYENCLQNGLPLLGCLRLESVFVTIFFCFFVGLLK